MNIFQYMTRDEILDRVEQLEGELRSCSKERLTEINKEIRAAGEALKSGNYRDDSEILAGDRRGSSLTSGEAMSLALGGSLRSGGSNGPIGPLREIGTYRMATADLDGGGESYQAVNHQKYEQRGADLKAGKPVEFGLDEINLRTVTVSSGLLVAPKMTSPTLGEAFNEVSSLVDLVNAPLLVGAESYSKGFVVGYGTGGYTAEEADAVDAEPLFDYATTGKHRISAYAEISSAVANLNNPDYQNEVMKAIRIALRKKLARQILIGGGPTVEQLTGIFSAPANVIPADSDIEIAAIDENTLDNIIFGFGGDESLEGGAWLILNKKDLAGFNAVRGSDGKKLYKIKLDANGNTGTISSDESFAVNFVINSVCTPLAEATAGDYCMAYGKPMAYEMPMFSPLVVERSTDFKFKSGMVAFRGESYVGGTPAGFKCFTRVKKAGQG